MFAFIQTQYVWEMSETFSAPLLCPSIIPHNLTTTLQGTHCQVHLTWREQSQNTRPEGAAGIHPPV